jgi:hypothetical protein
VIGYSLFLCLSIHKTFLVDRKTYAACFHVHQQKTSILKMLNVSETRLVDCLMLTQTTTNARGEWSSLVFAAAVGTLASMMTHSR